MTYWKIAVQKDRATHFNGWVEEQLTCFASPEVGDFLKLEKDDFIAVKTKVNIEIPPELCCVKISENVEKNCVNFVDRNVPDHVQLKTVKRNQLVQLDSIDIVAFKGRCQELTSLLSEVKENFRSAGILLPCAVGRIFTVNGNKIKVKNCFPVRQGLIHQGTEIKVSVEDGWEKSAPVDAHPFFRLFHFLFNLPSRRDLHSSFLNISYHLWKIHQFKWRFEECSSKLIRRVAGENFSTSSIVLVNDDVTKAEFCQIQTLTGIDIEVPVFRTPFVPRRKLMVSSNFLHNLKLRADEDHLLEGHHWYLKPMPSFRPPKATSITISSVYTSITELLTPKDLKSLLQHYFSSPKFFHYVPTSKNCLGNVFEIPIKSSLTVDSEHLEWNLEDLDDETVIKFQIESIKSTAESAIFEVGHGFTDFNLKTRTVYKPIFPPSKISILSMDGFSQPISKTMDRLPPFLMKEVEILMSYCVPLRPILLVAEKGQGQDLVVKELSQCLGLCHYQIEGLSLISETSGATEAKIKACFAKSPPNSLIHLTNLAILTGTDAKDLRIIESLRRELSCERLVIADIDPADKCPEISKLFDIDHQMRDVISSEDRETAMVWMLQKNETGCNFDFKDLIRRTSDFVYEDLATLFEMMEDFAVDRICQFPDSIDRQIFGFKPIISESDVSKSLKEMRSLLGDAIGLPTIPSVKWEDVGGLEDVKEEILDTIQTPLHHPELVEGGFKRSGILMHGPPGVGKTLLAKAVATECNLNFMSVKGPELLNMYIGQSEQNVREVFSRARRASPCIIFFDEIDALAPNRGKAGDSAGVMDRVVSQLLAELDGVKRDAMVFVIGATNRPDLVDPSLLRPGRFDRLVYLGIPRDKNQKLHILKSLTRKFELEGDFDLGNVTDILPEMMSGADLYAIAADAMTNAVSRKIHALERGARIDQEHILVSLDDFRAAISDFTPSASPGDF